MNRDEAIIRLRELVAQDLVPLAARLQVAMWRNGRLNKGWAGQVLERYLGNPLNSAQSPDFGSWELKVVPLKRKRNGEIVLKETMAITMIDPDNVLQTPFEESHLLAKLRRLVVCSRMFESREETSSRLVGVSAFNLDDSDVYSQVRSDYEEVRETIRTSGFEYLTGRMGVLVQPRTKGPGHGSISRAFYARKNFVLSILNQSNN